MLGGGGFTQGCSFNVVRTYGVYSNNMATECRLARAWYIRVTLNLWGEGMGGGGEGEDPLSRPWWTRVGRIA